VRQQRRIRGHNQRERWRRCRDPWHRQGGKRHPRQDRLDEHWADPYNDTTDEIKAAQATAAYANAYLGGLRGHPIELMPCEEKNVPATSQACGNTFVQDHVAAVAAGGPAQTDPMIQIVHPAGIPVALNIAASSVVLRALLHPEELGHAEPLPAW